MNRLLAVPILISGSILALAANQPGPSRAVLGPDGGAVEVQGFAKAIFPDGSLKEPAKVELRKDANPDLDRVFGKGTLDFMPKECVLRIMPDHLVLRVGSERPLKPAALAVTIPRGFFPAEEGQELLASASAESERGPAFEKLPARFDRREHTLFVELPPAERYYGSRSARSSRYFEATVLILQTRTGCEDIDSGMEAP